MSWYSNLIGVARATSGGALHTLSGISIVVEMAFPLPGTFILGKSLLGTDVLGDVTWQNVTTWVNYLEFSNGGQPSELGVPSTGQLSMRIVPTDDRFSPWTFSYYNGPRTYIRVTAYSSDATPVTYPMFVGVIENWKPVRLGESQQWTYEIIANEAAPYLLARINDTSTGSMARVGDTGRNLIFYLSDVVCPYEIDVNTGTAGAWLESPFNTFTFQGTDLSDNRLAEIKRIAADMDCVVSADKAGELRLCQRGYVDSGYILDTYELDSLEFANDDETLISRIYWSRTGGTGTYTDSSWIGNDFYRSTQKMDFGLQSDLNVPHVIGRWLSRNSYPFRPIAVTLNADHDASIVPILLDIDVGEVIALQAELDGTELLFGGMSIAGMTHQLQFAGQVVQWRCTLDLYPEHNYYIQEVP